MVSDDKIKNILSLVRSGLYNNELQEMLSSATNNDKNKIYSIISRAFDKEGDPNIRNELAIILHDIGDKRAVVNIMRAINDPNTKGYRGTLVYSLQGLNPIEYFYDLVNLVVNDNWETSDEALQVIEELEGKIDQESYLKSLNLVKVALKSNFKEKEKLEYLLDMLSNEQD